MNEWTLPRSLTESHSGFVLPTSLSAAGPMVAENASGPSFWTFILGAVVTSSVFASAYHGYRRNESVAWGAAWGVLGTVAPVITPAIAFAQGFGEPRPVPQKPAPPAASPSGA